MLQVGHILDLYCVLLSSVALFCKNYTKFYFDAKHLENAFVGAGNLKMITSKFWFEYLWGPYVLLLNPVLCIALYLDEEAYNLRRWLHEKELAC